MSPAQRESRRPLKAAASYQSGGHGSRTRNPISGAPHFQSVRLSVAYVQGFQGCRFMRVLWVSSVHRHSCFPLLF